MLRKNRFAWLFLAILLFIGVFGLSGAQGADTLRVVDSWGAPGDTAIVPIWLHNTILLEGFAFRVVFDSTILTPTWIDTSYRTGYFLTWEPDWGTGWIYHIAIASDLFGGGARPPLEPGSGEVAYLMFEVDSSAQLGSEVTVSFENKELHETVLVDTLFQEIYPICVNGTVTIVYNENPVIDPIPNGDSLLAYADHTLNFQVTASDLDGDQVTLSASGLPPGASFPTVQGDSTVTGEFNFTPNSSQIGQHFRVVFTASDPLGGQGHEAVTVYVEELTDQPPVFSQFPSSPQSVTEGEVLAFTVVAYDPEGGSVTLSTGSLPPNASFVDNHDGTGDFTFSPDFTQGPDDITVTFYAKDEADMTTSKNLQIVVIDQPKDVLKVENTGGALPDGNYGFTPISFSNTDSIYGLQFDLNFDPNSLRVDSIMPTERLSGFTIYDNIGDSLGVVRIMAMSYGLSVINSGTDPVMNIYFTVDQAAEPGTTFVTLTNAIEVEDIYGTTKDLEVEDGFFIVDRLGDVTLNCKVDVGDVVALVAYLLDQIGFNTRQVMVADVNSDEDVNVGDVVGIINMILGRPVSKGTLAKGLSEEWLAQVQLDLRDLENGNAYIWGKLDVAVAGVQIKVAYDPNQVTISAPKPTERVENFTLAYNDKDGVLTLLLFDLEGGAISTGEGNLFCLPVDIVSEDDSVDFELSQAIMADTTAWCIPVEIMPRNTGIEDALDGSFIPRNFALGQNYPNPFNSSTIIRYQVPVVSGQRSVVSRQLSADGGRRTAVTLKVYNTLGQRVATLAEGEVPPGYYQVSWDGRGDGGVELSSGIYFYSLTSGGFKETKKMLMIK